MSTHTYVIDMAIALANCVGLGPGGIVITLGVEYSGAWRNVEKILGEEDSVVTPKYYDHTTRILVKDSCPC